ncbi:methyl-CpG-binding domain-containing protein 11-like [Malania oleifera]|uniref:methyl-CpG-binding domain-containing protein 11-like n=1 Tax=Malania oleifera TaxID=397392 RepID=UPI0025AE9B43|nr:methyl-CpG-binding domain-containing protein 11-like [Malania oleifera]
MASEVDKDKVEQPEEEHRDDVVSIELPAPKGWTKLYTPKKTGTPRRNEIVFITPTGEEIKNKRHLNQFLKSHPGGPAASEFDWGTGDTPRRSSRISEKSKATETPESEPPKKVRKKSSSKKGSEEKKVDTDGDDEVGEDKTDEAAKTSDVEMKDEEGGAVVGEQSEGKITAKADVTAVNTGKDSEQKTEQKIDDLNIEKLQNQDDTNIATSDRKEEQQGRNSSMPTCEPEERKEEAEKQPSPMLEEKKETEKLVGTINEAEKEAAKHKEHAEAPPLLPVPDEIVSSEKEVKASEGTCVNVEKDHAEGTKADADSIKEMCAEKLTNVGEVRPEKGSLSDGQGVENHSTGVGEA